MSQLSIQHFLCLVIQIIILHHELVVNEFLECFDDNCFTLRICLQLGTLIVQSFQSDVSIVGQELVLISP